MDDYILKVEGVSKSFPGVQALKDVSFCVKRGEIHALVGENGAGKSTLIKILCGVYTADEGRVFFRDRQLVCRDPMDAQRCGISVVHQEIKLVDTMSVMENIFLGRPRVNKLGLVDWKAMRKDAAALLESLNVQLDPEEMVAHLSVAQKQIVEICKALSYKAELIIMDEPSATLTEKELNVLFEIIEKLRADGMAIIYISHRMEEIFRLADMVTVLRDGCRIDTMPVAKVTRELLINLMVGRELGMEYPKMQAKIGECVLRVKNLSRGRVLHDISFELRRGEILGFAGLVGAGRTEVARAIMGADGSVSGEIELFGKPFSVKNVRHAIKNGIGFVTEDRKKQGLVLNMTVAENLSLVNMNSVMRRGMRSERLETQVAQQLVDMLHIVTPGVYQKVANLSGGNQQKVVIGKWLNADCEILIVDEPTRGIDVGAKAEIYKLLCQLAGQGKAVIMISSDMPELLGVCDRIVVMHDGRITGELGREEATQNRIMELAIS